MSLILTPSIEKPSNIIPLPNRFIRPAFEELYGFDTQALLFDPNLTFPTIQVFDNESEFISATYAPDYTIVHAKDTDRLYVWDGTEWLFYNNDI
jgi:hypothetical protein